MAVFAQKPQPDANYDQILLMDINDLNRRLRYALEMDDDSVFDALRLSGHPATIEQIASWRIKQGDDGYAPCPAPVIHAMLDGVVTQRRGPRDDGAASSGQVANETKPASLVDNNQVLKQLRVALSLKTDEVHAIIESVGGKLSKGELNALFRKPAARNYRRCGDQVLRWFLTGIARSRGEGS